MLNVNAKFVKVWKPEEKENIAKNTIFANISTSRKKEDDTYENISWQARFVGGAYENAKTLNDGDTINIINGIITNRYDKEKQQLWVTVVIFEFELADKK